MRNLPDRSTLEKRWHGSNWLLFIPLAILFAIVVIAPAFDAAIASVDVGPDRFSEIERTMQFGFGNYRNIFRDRAIFYSLNITVLWAFSNSVLSLAIGLLLAHWMTERTRASKHQRDNNLTRKRNTSLLHSFLLIPLGIPIYIAVPLWRAFLHGDSGLSVFSRITGITLNLVTDPLAAFAGALMASVWLNIPMTAFVIHAHLNQVEPEMIDAARLETKHIFTIMRYIQLPIIRTSVLTMLALNFVKAFKEFTLIHLMTGGGVPLVSGITERYIIGSTTTVGVFIYNLFTSTDSYGITAAFSVLMGTAVAFVLLFWTVSNIGEKRKRIVYFKLLLMIVLSGDFVIHMTMYDHAIPYARLLFLALFAASFAYRKIFTPTAYALLAYIGMDVVLNGFLQGFSPAVPAVLFTLAQKREYASILDQPHDFLLPTNSRMGKELARLRYGLEQIGEWGYRTTMLIVVAGTIASTIIIVYYLVWLSVSELNACYFDTLLPPRMSLQAFVTLFKTEHIMKYFANTAILAVGSAVVVPLVVIPAAWHLSTIKKQRANTIVSAIHTLGTMGGMHSLIPLFSIFLALGMINSYTGLILIYVVHAIPFSLVNMKNFFENYSRELREPAVIEGATTFQYIRWVLVPLSKPIIKTSMLLAFLGAWNGFNAPLLFLTEESMYPVSLKLYTYVGSIASGNPRWTLFAAASIVNLIIISAIGSRRATKDPTEKAF